MTGAKVLHKSAVDLKRRNTFWRLKITKCASFAKVSIPLHFIISMSK